MTLVVGTDEAGYGPNLGPLVVAATLWDVAGPAAEAEAILAAASAALDDPWRDSKQVYRGGSGWAALEHGALAALTIATGAAPADWRSLVAAGAVPEAAGEPPERDTLEALTLPRAAPAHETAARAGVIAAGLAAHGVRLVAVHGRIVQPAQFNRLLGSGLNKSDILSQTTLELAAGILPAVPRGPAAIWCDRHGGRRRYAALLAAQFETAVVHVLAETAGHSAYELPAAGCRFEFTVGGEGRMPVALASMTAKYLRELSMLAFNAHWSARIPGLGETAGYPVDAARWRGEAEAAVRVAAVPWESVWRRV
jgi:ribonuclease HII